MSPRRVRVMCLFLWGLHPLTTEGPTDGFTRYRRPPPGKRLDLFPEGKRKVGLHPNKRISVCRHLVPDPKFMSDGRVLRNKMGKS